MKAASALFNGLLLLLVALGVRDVFFVYERNRCSMTYMYEYPEYQKVKLPKKSARLFPAYELHLYGEGIYAEKNKQLNALNGIPVLFLPGNAGSYKQARSFGSIALRKSENIDYRYHFDVFTVNFNEELVAFYGGSLKRQTEFVNVCIKKILHLYKNQEFPPQSVIIIGHSMGGLIARALFTLKTFKPQLINLIITQATPHVMPVLTIDSYLTDFYAMVNNYWILNAKELQNVTILSVAGGFRDFQVRSGLAILPASNLYANALSVVSTSVPRTWASTDHLSIVWCKELILATARALFDLIDEDTKQIINRPEKKMSVLNHHFVRHPAKQYESSYETTASVPVSSTWVFIEARNWKHSVAVECSETYFAFPLLNKRNIHSHFHCRSTHLNTQSWIFGCKEGSTKCLNIEDLSWNSELLLSAKTVTLKLDSFPNTTHFVIYQPRINNTEFSVECEFLKEELKTQQLPVTHAFSFGFSSSRIQINSSGLLHFIQLQGFSKIYQAFDIFIEKSCKEPKEDTPNMFRLHVPWSHEDIIRTSSNDAPVQLFAKLHEPQSQNDSRMVTLMLYTSQDCHYEITVYTSFLQMLGQMIRFHGASLPVYIVSNLLLAYGSHLYFLSSKGHCLEFDASMDMAAKPYKVDPIVNICRFLLGYEWFKNTWDNLMLPPLDSSELYSLGLLFPVASLFLFMFGTGVAYWSGTFFKSIIGLMAALWRAVKRNTNAPEKSSSFTYNALVEAILYSLVSWKTCGAFGILLVFVRYLVKVVKMQSELWRSPPSNNGVSRQTTNTEDLTSAPSTESDSSTEMDSEDLVLNSQQAEDSDLMTTSDSLKMHITIINLLLWLTLLVLPSFIYWVKNLRYNIQLNPDPIRLLAVPLIFSVIILMNANVVSMKSSKLLKTAARLQLPFSIFIVAFGTLHLYRVSYFIVLSLSIHALTCLF